MGLFADRHLTSRRREKGKRVGLTFFWGHAENFGRSFLIEIEAKWRLAAGNRCGVSAVGPRHAWVGLGATRNAGKTNVN